MGSYTDTFVFSGLKSYRVNEMFGFVWCFMQMLVAGFCEYKCWKVELLADFDQFYQSLPKVLYKGYVCLDYGFQWLFMLILCGSTVL